MIKYLTSSLPATSMPSWRLADGPRTAQGGKAMTTGLEAARKPIAPIGATAYAHVVCAAQHSIQVMGDNSVSLAVSANEVEPFGTQAQAQLSVDVTRVDGRAGSPPRGEPV